MAGRVQINDLRAPEVLQPTPIQSDTFTGTPHVSGDNQFTQLADALGHFSEALINLRATQQTKAAKDPTLENQFASMTEAQRAQVARTGTLPDGTQLHGNPHGPAVMKAAGMADASVLDRQVREHLTTDYDWSSGDVDGYLTGAQNTYLKENGVTDPFAVKGFLERFSQTRAWALEEQSKYRQDATQKYKGDVTYQVLSDGVSKLIGDGKSPEEVHAGVREMYKTLGKNGTLGIDYNKLDSFVVHIAANLASTNPEVAKALITSERTGAGPAKDPIINNLSLKSEAEAVVKAADKAIVKKDADTQEHQLFVDNAKRVVGGDYKAFDDVVIPDGTQDGRKITKKEQEDHFAQKTSDYFSGQVADHKLTEQAASNLEVHYFRPMGIDHPFLKNEIDHLEKRVSPDVVTDPAQMADLTQRLAKYHELRAAGKNYTLSQLSTPTKDFLDAIDIAQRYEKYDLPRALLFANRVTNPTEGQVVDLARYRDDITKKVQSTMSTGMFGFGNDLNNDGVMMGTYVARAESYATKLVAAGMDPTKAIDISTKRLKENLPVYNGRALPGLELQPLADNWQSGLTNVIKDNIVPNMSKDFEGQNVFPVVLEGGKMIFENSDGQIIKNKQGNVMATNVSLINQASNRLSLGDFVGKLPEQIRSQKDAVIIQNRTKNIQQGKEPGFLDKEGGLYYQPENNRR